MRERKAVPSERFNYTLFRTDLNKACKEKRVSLAYLSEEKFFRSRNYLCSSLDAQKLPLKIIISLCDYFGLSVKDYATSNTPVKREEEPTAPVVPTVCDSLPLIFNVVFGGKLFTCETKVSSEMGSVSSTLSYNGEIIKRGTGFYHDDSIVSMLRGISYGIYALATELKKEE